MKRAREDYNDENNFPENKKIKNRGVKRTADDEPQQHFPRKSMRIQTQGIKRKSNWANNPPAKRQSLQTGRGKINWICF